MADDVTAPQNTGLGTRGGAHLPTFSLNHVHYICRYITVGGDHCRQVEVGTGSVSLVIPSDTLWHANLKYLNLG